MRDYLQLHLVILAWGFTAILGKLIDLPPLEVTIWRTSLACAGLVLIAKAKGVPLRVSRADLPPLLISGLLIGVHWLLFFLSARLASASVALAALPTMMIWCSLIEPVMNGGFRWKRMELLAGGVMVGAVWLIYRVELSQWLGFTVGLVSALFAAVFSVMNKSLTMRHHPIRLCAWQMAVACGACLLLFPAAGQGTPALPTLADWGWLLVLSQLCTVGAYVAYLDVLRRLSVFAINVVYNLEPVYGIVLAVLFFGQAERMSPGFYAGAAIIVSAVLILPWLSRPRRPAPDGLS